MNETRCLTTDMAWEKTDDFPGETRVRALRHDDGGGARTLMVKIPSGGTIPAHCHRGTVQIYVLEGQCERSGLALTAGSFVMQSGHLDVPATTSREGAILLLVIDPTVVTPAG